MSGDRRREALSASGSGMFAMLAEQVDLALRLRRMSILFDSERCLGCLECYEVCPVGCWLPDDAPGKAAFVEPERCVACGACVLQCPEGAIELG